MLLKIIFRIIINNRWPRNLCGYAWMECWLLATLPINTGLLLTRQGFHFTNCSNLSFLKSLIGDQSGCHTVGPLAFIIDAIRTANPVWHQSSSVCHDYSSSQDSQSQRNSLSSLPESTPRITSQNLVFLWTAHHSTLESLLKFQDFIPLLVYSNDKKPAEKHNKQIDLIFDQRSLSGVFNPSPLLFTYYLCILHLKLCQMPSFWFNIGLFFKETGALNDLGSYWVF